MVHCTPMLEYFVNRYAKSPTAWGGFLWSCANFVLLCVIGAVILVLFVLGIGLLELLVPGGGYA